MIGARARWVAVAVALASLTVLGTTSPAWARDPSAAELAQARDLFAKAERDERAQDWKGALEKLERAGEVKMTAGIRFHIALCRENLGALVEALADYEAATAQARADHVLEVLEAARDPLADLRARVPSLSLVIVNAPLEAVDVSIDDRALGTAVLLAPVRLLPGTHRIVARRRDAGPNGHAFTKVVELHERDTVALDLTLPADTPSNSDPNRGAGAIGTPQARALAPTEEPTQAPSRTHALVATGGSVLLIGGGVAAFLLAGTAQHDLRSCASPDDCSGKRDVVRTWDALALAAWVSGAGAGALATVLWLKPSHAAQSTSRRTERATRLALAPAWGGASLAGSF